MTPNGKIARLPKHVRHQLNRRLRNGESEREILAWLHARSDESGAERTSFGESRPGMQDLTEWKETGYRDWQMQQEALGQVRQLAAEVTELRAAGEAPLTEHLAGWLAAQYVVTAKAAARQAEGAGVDLKTLRAVCGDVVALRRGDHYAQHLELERERLELDRQLTQDRLEELFQEWAQRRENQRKSQGSWLSEEEKAARIRAIFGLAPLERDAEEAWARCDPALLI